MIQPADYVTRKFSHLKKRGLNIWLYISCGVALLLLLLFFFYLMSKNPSNTKEISQNKKNQVTLPQKPLERWTYLKKLENPDGEVTPSSLELTPSTAAIDEVLANNHSPVISRQWFIQCGAFRDEQNAQLLKAQVAMAGFDSYIEKKKLYRLLVGTYKNRQQAEEIINRLRQSKVTSCIIKNK